MEQMHNGIFRVELSPEEGWFSFITQDEELPNLLRSRLRLEYRVGGKKVSTPTGAWQVNSTRRSTERLTTQGDTEIIHFELAQDGNGIALALDFGIVREYPLILWKASVKNQGSQPVRIERMMQLDLNSRTGKVDFEKARKPSDMGFFTNGWQSWSTTQWYPADEPMQISRLGSAQLPMIQYAGTPLLKKKGHFSSDFFAAIGDRKSRNGFLMGFLSQKEQFGSITCSFGRSISLQMWANGDDVRLDPGRTFSTDWAVFNPIQLDHRDPLGKYTEAVARENAVRLPADVPVGWCSWYQYYTRVTAADVEKNLNFILDKQEELPVQLVQIDDGFETQVGDWFSFKDSFKEGVKSLADSISSQGLTPGLWLAPFAVHPKSQLMKDHPDWILRTARGKPVNAGFGWGTFFTGLDLTVPEALAYAAKVVRTAETEWGFPYLKLDFLYTAALPGVYRDETVTRAQVMRMGMQTIRDAVGQNTFLLGCGAPLGSVIGLVDANRIGPDVSGDWAPRVGIIQGMVANELGVPCARNSIRSIITRANLNRRWWINDPDCLLIRPKMALKAHEVRSLASVIALTGGALLISDNLTDVPEDRLRIAESLLPPIGEQARVIDWFDRKMPEKLRVDLDNETGGWTVLGAFNWDDVPHDFTLTPASFGLDDGEYWLCEFWSGHLRRFSSDHPARYRQVPAHSGLVLSARIAEPGKAVYIGSDLHISQGMEVSSWQETGGGLEIKFRLPRTAQGNIVISVPKTVGQVLLNGLPVEFIQQNAELLQIPLMVEGFADVEVIYTA